MTIKTISETQEPQPNKFVADTFERGLDPWHPDAFKGTIAEGAFLNPNNEPRQAGWYMIDWCGNVVGWVPDGIELEFPD